MKLYRVMKIDSADGRPLVGTRRNMLGVRPTDPANTNPGRRFDVSAVADSDMVVPGTREGLSVSTDPAELFPVKGEAIWEIDEADLLPVLIPQPDRPPHHVLEPGRAVTFAGYQLTLVATRPLWVRVP